MVCRVKSFISIQRVGDVLLRDLRRGADSAFYVEQLAACEVNRDWLKAVELLAEACLNISTNSTGQPHKISRISLKTSVERR